MFQLGRGWYRCRPQGLPCSGTSALVDWWYGPGLASASGLSKWNVLPWATGWVLPSKWQKSPIHTGLVPKSNWIWATGHYQLTFKHSTLQNFNCSTATSCFQIFCHMQERYASCCLHICLNLSSGPQASPHGHLETYRTKNPKPRTKGLGLKGFAKSAWICSMAQGLPRIATNACCHSHQGYCLACWVQLPESSMLQWQPCPTSLGMLQNLSAMPGSHTLLHSCPCRSTWSGYCCSRNPNAICRPMGLYQQTCIASTTCCLVGLSHQSGTCTPLRCTQARSWISQGSSSKDSSKEGFQSQPAHCVWMQALPKIWLHWRTNCQASLVGNLCRLCNHCKGYACSCWSSRTQRMSKANPSIATHLHPTGGPCFALLQTLLWWTNPAHC